MSDSWLVPVLTVVAVIAAGLSMGPMRSGSSRVEPATPTPEGQLGSGVYKKTKRRKNRKNASKRR
jgi:hypothetical protein